MREGREREKKSKGMRLCVPGPRNLQEALAGVDRYGSLTLTEGMSTQGPFLDLVPDPSVLTAGDAK